MGEVSESEPVAYLLAEFLNNHAQCQCGWTGKRRWLRGSAVFDVMDHGTKTGHMPVGTLRALRIWSAFAA